MLLRPAWSLVAVVLATAVVSGRGPQSPGRAGRSFRSSVEVVSLSATVTDASGHPVIDLPRDAFSVYEDGEAQTVTQFASERVPVSVGVLLDTSDSMFGQRIADARAAVETFLFEQLAPTDEYFVLAFNHAPTLLTGWTGSRQVVAAALAGIRPSGGTAVHDALLAALPLVDARANRRASLLVISDGADTASTASMRDLLTALHRTDAFVYAIAIDSPGRRAINTRVDAAALATITGETGGRTETVHATGDLSSATARIAEELNSQYVLGYSSPRATDGRFHSLRVQVNRPGFKVRSRRGYVGG